MKLTNGALVSLHDSCIKRGGDPETVTMLLSMLLRSAIKSYQGTKDWAEDETVAAEEELAAIEEACGEIIEVDDDTPKGIMQYVEGASD